MNHPYYWIPNIQGDIFVYNFILFDCVMRKTTLNQLVLIKINYICRQNRSIKIKKNL